MKYCISLDWFQLFGKRTAKTQLVLDTYICGDCNCPAGYRPAYRVLASRERHPIFREAYCVCLNGFPLVHIFASPKMSVMAPESVAIKVANRALYSSTWAWYLCDILRLTFIEPISITRIDICCDFQKFAGDLNPSDFIQRYLRDGNDPNDEQYIRVGSNKYCVHGNKRGYHGERPNYWERRIFKDVSGTDEGISPHDFSDEPLMTWSQHEYLRFGSRKSGVSTYLYNKSLELLEKKSKPYISEMWQSCGIIEDDTLPVYRLEFSINSKGLAVENKNARPIAKKIGCRDLRHLAIEDFSTQASIEDIFWGYANKYWRFKKVTQVKYRKDMPDIQLFDVQIESTILPRDISKTLDTGRAELNAAKTLCKIAEQFPCLETESRNKLMAASHILVNLGAMKKAVFEYDIPPELWFYSEDKDAWKLFELNYYSRPAHRKRLQYYYAQDLANDVNKIVKERLKNPALYC